jgi:chromosome segregation ATPase
MKKAIMMLSLVGLLFGCNDLKKQERAQRAIDSLRNELQTNQKLTATLTEIGTLIDSIDASRNMLRLSMAEGTSYESYTSRMKEINQYVHDAQRRIETLEKESVGVKSNATAYAQAINKLKSELETRTHELNALKELVSQYKNENDNLISTVGLQKAEIDDKLSQIKTKQVEMANLQAQVNELLVKSTVDQGEAYFARAAAVEETANRTRFAPRKKKNSRKEALELYKLALTFGKEEAKERIAGLEKKI